MIFLLSFDLFYFLQKILLSRLIAHAVIGSIFGYLYLNVGTLATTVIGNYVYLYGSMLLVVYTGKMSVMMSCKYKENSCILSNWKIASNLHSIAAVQGRVFV